MSVIWRAFWAIQWVAIAKHIDNERFIGWDQAAQEEKLNVLKRSQITQREEEVYCQHYWTIARPGLKGEKLVQKQVQRLLKESYWARNYQWKSLKLSTNFHYSKLRATRATLD